jgi:hypothetical protein
MVHLLSNLPSICIQFTGGGEEAPQNLEITVREPAILEQLSITTMTMYAGSRI